MSINLNYLARLKPFFTDKRNAMLDSISVRVFSIVNLPSGERLTLKHHIQIMKNLSQWKDVGVLSLTLYEAERWAILYNPD